MTPYYEHAGITIYHGDCREILPQLPALPGPSFVLTDPPYGAGLSFDYAQRFQASKRNPVKGGRWWSNADRASIGRHTPVRGDDEPFDPAHLMQYGRLVLFGANHYASRLPDCGGWIVWDKRRGIEDAQWPMSEAELAWTNLGEGVRVFRHRWFGLIRDSEKGEHFHPTQKPVALMKWILERWGRPDDLLLDPYCGSGPALIAASELKLRAIGIEIEEKYCEIAAKRLSQEVLVCT
jgi:site-specific DNA-methyltransferase (adenine-specific)